MNTEPRESEVSDGGAAGQRYHAILDTLMRIGRAHRRIIDGRIRGLGIHPSQHIVLMHLTELGRTNSQARIAAHLDVSPASVARTLKNLDECGYIERSDFSDDNRCNEICITEKGRAVVEESRKIFDELNGSMFSGFTPAEIDTLGALLGKMLNNLNETDSDKNQKEMKTV